MIITASRYHDFSAGHRVVGHENRCALLHGHNYRVIFTCSCYEPSVLDAVGRVLDFAAIKSRLCIWLEREWDHRFLAWEEDELMHGLVYMKGTRFSPEALEDHIVWIPFNPTAENIAKHLLLTVGPKQLEGTGVRLTKVIVEETRRCSAEASL